MLPVGRKFAPQVQARVFSGNKAIDFQTNDRQLNYTGFLVFQVILKMSLNTTFYLDNLLIVPVIVLFFAHCWKREFDLIFLSEIVPRNR